MALRDTIDGLGSALDGDAMTGRQAAIFVAVWMAITALIGVISYYVVFVVIGF